MDALTRTPRAVAGARPEQTTAPTTTACPRPGAADIAAHRSCYRWRRRLAQLICPQCLFNSDMSVEIDRLTVENDRLAAQVQELTDALAVTEAENDLQYRRLREYEDERTRRGRGGVV